MQRMRINKNIYLVEKHVGLKTCQVKENLFKKIEEKNPGEKGRSKTLSLEKL